MVSQNLKEDPLFFHIKSLPVKIYVAYGMGHILNDVCAAMWFSYLLVFFHWVLQFDSNQAGILLLVGQVADAVATPIIGYHSDQDHEWWLYRFGKRKIWYFLGTALVMLTFPFIFSPCIGCQESSKNLQLVYYSFFISFFQFGWAAVQISHMALIPEITPKEHHRTKLAAIRNGGTVIASVMVYLVTWGILHISGGSDSKISPNDVSKFQNIVWSVMSFGFVCSIIFYIFIKEPVVRKTNLQTKEEHKSNIMGLFKDHNLYLVAVIYMSARLFLNLTQVFISLYLLESLDMVASALALIPLAMYIASFIASIPVGLITKWIGRTITYLIGAILGVTACLWIQWGQGNTYTTYLIFGVVFLLGTATTIVLVSSLDITTDLIDSKNSSNAFIYGIMSFADKLANGIVVEIIQHFHKEEGNTSYYKNVMSYACGGAVVLGSVAVLLLKTIRIRKSKSGRETPQTISTIS